MGEPDEKKWRELLTERELKEVWFNEVYAGQEFRHGTDGHNLRLICAKLAEMLDRVEASGVDILKLYHPKDSGQ